MPKLDSTTPWRKSRRSSVEGQCVEVADLTEAVAVRDSKNPNGPKLSFSPTAWQAFADRIKAGQLDL